MIFVINAIVEIINTPTGKDDPIISNLVNFPAAKKIKSSYAIKEEEIGKKIPINPNNCIYN